jgi:hypothetical protein
VLVEDDDPRRHAGGLEGLPDARHRRVVEQRVVRAGCRRGGLGGVGHGRSVGERGVSDPSTKLVP